MPTKRNRAIGLRRPSPAQGRGLEITGHAIEYLIDNYVTNQSGSEGKQDQQAAQILMGCNLAIFEECPEVVTLTQRIHKFLDRILTDEDNIRTEYRLMGDPTRTRNEEN